jgi:hypothetical protein
LLETYVVSRFGKGAPMTWSDLFQLLLEKLGNSLSGVVPYLGVLLLGIVWCAWWLAGVNWHKLWPALAKGAWAPAALLAMTAALVWTQLQPMDCHCLGSVTIPNGWWQTGIVTALLATALFCGWLQGTFHWAPPEISVEPPAHGHAHDHGHAHH